MLITITRTSKTADGIFGNLCIDGNPFKCVTIENLEKAIPAGTYEVFFDYSPHFNRILPHVKVPSRDEAAGGDAGIRLHWGNVPSNYEGCIGLGSGVDGDSIDNTVTTFNQFYKIVDGQTPLSLNVIDIANFYPSQSNEQPVA